VGHGRLELYAEKESHIEVGEFLVSGSSDTGREALLATDALAGIGADTAEWRGVSGGHYRFGTGWESAKAQASAKWNYMGRGFRLWAPKGPEYGAFEVLVNGQRVATIDCKSAKLEPSSIVLEHSLETGYHAVVIRALNGTMPLDTLEIESPLKQ
jgi:hypothetical protein